MPLDMFQKNIIWQWPVVCLIATWYVYTDLTLISCLPYCHLKYLQIYHSDQFLALMPLDMFQKYNTDLFSTNLPFSIILQRNHTKPALLPLYMFRNKSCTLIWCLPFWPLILSGFFSKEIALIYYLPYCNWIFYERNRTDLHFAFIIVARYVSKEVT